MIRLNASKHFVEAVPLRSSHHKANATLLLRPLLESYHCTIHVESGHALATIAF